MNKYTCIKPACTNEYESEEAEAYYCGPCQEANKVLAKQIDAQVAARPKRSTVSRVKQYEEQLKNSDMKAGGLPGVHVKI